MRHWIETRYPPALRHVPDQLRWSAIKDWHGLLLAAGIAVVVLGSRHAH